ncbi:zinc finger, CCHC-type containing protein [Tanacetum coccineum]
MYLRLGIIDGLDETEPGYQGRCLSELVFCGGEGDDKELVVIGDVGGVLLGGGDGDDGGRFDNLVMDMPNLEGTGYTKETIRVEYEWKPTRCSTCLVFGHLFDDCSKAPKQVLNKMDKGNKNFKSVSVKPKLQYHPKAKQSTEGANQKTTPSVGKKNVSTSGNSTFSLSNSFEALTVENSVSGEVKTGKKASTSDNDGKPLKKVDYSGDQDSEDEIKSVDNEMASYLASKSLGVGYGTKSLLEQCRETYVNGDYDPYDIQPICYNLDIKVRVRMKK